MSLSRFKKEYIFLFIFFIISIISIKSTVNYLPNYLNNLYIKEIIYYFLGFLILYILNKLDIKISNKIINYLYITGIVLLILLLFIGESVNGSKCWLLIPFLGSFQVSEYIKIVLVLKISYDIEFFYKRKRNLKDEYLFFFKCLIIILIPSILTFLEPDTGQVIIYLFSTFMIFLFSPINKKIIISFLVFISIILILFIYLYYYNHNLFIKLMGFNIYYRIDRIIDWKKGSGLQLENSIIAIGSSYLYGHGIFNMPLYFPEAHTDFIFSVYASNFGFIGIIVLLTSMFMFDILLLDKIDSYRYLKDKLVLIGFISIIVFQQIINISMTFGLVPIMGITLPFISYGGSSLLSFFTMLGIINKKSKYSI